MRLFSFPVCVNVYFKARGSKIFNWSGQELEKESTPVGPGVVEVLEDLFTSKHISCMQEAKH